MMHSLWDRLSSRSSEKRDDRLESLSHLRGMVRFYEGPHWKRGKLLWEQENLVVNTALTALASLLGNTSVASNVVAIVGFGSGSTTPTVGDTGLGANPAYYNAIGAATVGPAGGVAAGSVQFGYSLVATDYASNPLTIQELGLFANGAGLSFPAAAGTANPAWAAATVEAVGNLIVDSNGNIQRVNGVTGDNKTGGSAPAWSTTIGNTTNDNHVTWTLVALHTPPSPMIAHVVVPSFPYTGGGNYSGTWTISM
jgi:hypothetical protein